MLKTNAKKKNRTTLFIVLMLAFPIAHTLFFTFYMNVSTFIMSLYRYDGDKEMFVGLLNYENVLKDIFVYKGDILAAFGNSLTVVPINVCLILPIAILFSYFLYRKIRGYKIYRVIFFLPSIISVVTLVLVFKYMFDETFGPMTALVKSIGLGGLIGNEGWFGTRDSAYGMLATYLCWAGVGYNILLIQGAMLRVPQDVIESGRLDGVGMIRELFQLILPMIFSTVSTMILFGVMGMFTMFIQPQLLFGTSIGDRLTVPLYIVNMTKAGGKNGQAGAATMGVLITLVGAPIMIGLRALLNKLTPDVEY